MLCCNAATYVWATTFPMLTAKATKPWWEPSHKGLPPPEELVRLIHGRIINHHGIDVITASLKGVVSLAEIDMISQLRDELDMAEAHKEKCQARMLEICEREFPEELRRLQTIPGIKERTATSLIAEIGTDMNKFETANHLASWSGLNESNKKIKSRSITHGNVYLRKTIIECAWAASRTKDCFFSRFSYHQTQVRKKNKMKVLVAVARKMLIAVWHVLHDNIIYIDFTTDRKTSQTRGWTRYTARLQAIILVMVTPRLQINHTDGRLWKPVWVQTRRGKYNYMNRPLFALGSRNLCTAFLLYWCLVTFCGDIHFCFIEESYILST